ncbi:MAG TPA: hypothetical protein VGP25_16225, partial [Gemmatimonadaceae bacterium]|nr:hypothetical protein [Gemmatimonadaceae bacterium]
MSTKKTARPLTLAGFDVQFSTPADTRRWGLVRRVLGATGDTVTANDWAAFDSTTSMAIRTAPSNDARETYVRTNF